MLFAVAIHMHFGLEPACVVERTSFDEGDARHYGGVSENGRTALRTEVPVNRLTAIPFVVKRLEPPLNYDIITIVEAPDEISATALNLSISALGNVHTESLRAFSAAEMMTIVDKMI
jgi:hypothetical protein